MRLQMEDRSIVTAGHLQGLLLGSPLNEKVLVEEAPGLRPDAGVSLGHRLHAVFQQHEVISGLSLRARGASFSRIT